MGAWSVGAPISKFKVHVTGMSWTRHPDLAHVLSTAADNHAKIRARMAGQVFESEEEAARFGGSPFFRRNGLGWGGNMAMAEEQVIR